MRSDALLPALLALVVAVPLHGQEPPAGDPPPDRPPAAPAGDVEPVRPAPPPVGALSTARARRAPLLREGSHVVRVRGRLDRDEPRQAWVFVIKPTVPGDPVHELTIMPNSLLGEVESIVDSAPDRVLHFELTGQVFVYRQRNYFLATHPPLLVEHEPRETAVPAAAPDEAGPAGDDDDSTDAIIRDLRRDAGPVPRRRPADEDPAGASGDEAAPARLMAEGDVLVSRRGRIQRSGGGAFTFVFDADAEGLADPPMTILPCLLLERLERYVRRSGERAAVLITGRVYTHDRRNYLLPTVYRIPRERTRLTP
jgi:hypothetical protein